MHVKLADFIRGFVVHAPVSCHLPGTCRAGVLPFLCPKHRPSVGQLCSDNIAAPTRRDSETTGNSEREIRESWPCPEPWQSCRDRNTEASGAAFCDVRSEGVDRRGGAAVLGSVEGTSAGPQLPWQLVGNLLPDQHSCGAVTTHRKWPLFRWFPQPLRFLVAPRGWKRICSKKDEEDPDILDFFFL